MMVAVNPTRIRSRSWTADLRYRFARTAPGGSAPAAGGPLGTDGWRAMRDRNAELGQDLVLETDEFGAGHASSGLRHRHVDDTLDPAGPAGHDIDAVREMQGFLDVVGHQQTGMAVPREDAQQL